MYHGHSVMIVDFQVFLVSRYCYYISFLYIIHPVNIVRLNLVFSPSVVLILFTYYDFLLCRLQLWSEELAGEKFNN